MQKHNHFINVAVLAFFSLLTTSAFSQNQNVISAERYVLPDGESILAQARWPADGELGDIQISLQMQSHEGASLREIARPTMASLPIEGRHVGLLYLTVRVAVKEQSGLAILYSVSATGMSEDGYYLRLEDSGDGNFRKKSELQLSGLFPARHSAAAEPLKKVYMTGLESITVVHADDFKAEITISSDNRVAINGKSCSPDGGPIKQLYYPYFLFSLSPATAQSHWPRLVEAKGMSWWGQKPHQGPFTVQEVMDMGSIITWVTPPQINPATIPANGKPSASSGFLSLNVPSVKPPPSPDEVKPDKVEAQPASPSWLGVVLISLLGLGIVGWILRRRGAPKA